jgi:hypothetical protein
MKSNGILMVTEIVEPLFVLDRETGPVQLFNE